MTNYFKSALNDFAFDVAAGDAIRHLANKGMTIKEIADNLSFPVPIEQIKATVWKHYLSNGTIKLENPQDCLKPVTQSEFICERDKYGRMSYRKVEKIISEEIREYVPCDFGKRLYSDRKNFEQSLAGLEKDDREYILDLPWPLETVFHVKNERMMRIEKCLNEPRKSS